MTNKEKIKAVELLIDLNCTIELNPVLNNNIVNHDYIALTDCPQKGIELLLDSNYHLSLQNGKIIVDKFKY